MQSFDKSWPKMCINEYFLACFLLKTCYFLIITNEPTPFPSGQITFFLLKTLERTLRISFFFCFPQRKNNPTLCETKQTKNKKDENFIWYHYLIYTRIKTFSSFFDRRSRIVFFEGESTNSFEEEKLSLSLWKVLNFRNNDVVF